MAYTERAVPIGGNLKKEEIVKALQYSGLGLTEDSEKEEIYAVLAAYFPATRVLLDGSTGVRNWTLTKTGGKGSVTTVSDVGVRFTATENDDSDSDLDGSMTSNSSYDFTAVKKIKVTSYYGSGKDGTLKLHIINSSGTIVKSTTLFDFSVNGSAADDPSTVVNSEVNVSSITGNCSIKLDVRRGAYCTPGTYTDVRNVTLVY